MATGRVNHMQCKWFDSLFKTNNWLTRGIYSQSNMAIATDLNIVINIYTLQTIGSHRQYKFKSIRTINSYSIIFSQKSLFWCDDFQGKLGKFHGRNEMSRTSAAMSHRETVGRYPASILPRLWENRARTNYCIML